MHGVHWEDAPSHRREMKKRCRRCGDPILEGHRVAKVGLVCLACDRVDLAETTTVEPAPDRAALVCPRPC